jgi:peptidoglycan/LPS O-acetylase OafA/YrhL
MRLYKKHVPELDGLRGIAVIVVIVSHSANAGFLPSFLGAGFGQQGVALFYLLSGYLIFYLYFDQDFTKQNLMQYTIARSARVLPLFYAAVLIAIVVLAITGCQIYSFSTLNEIMANLLLIHGTSVLWSIPVEIQFYALFVCLWWARSSGYSVWWVFAGLFAIQVVLAAFFVLQTDIPTSILPCWLHFFIIGGIASLIRPNISIPNWVGFVTLCALPFALPEIRRMLGVTILPNYLDPITAGYPILMFLLVLWKIRTFRFLAHPLLRYAGQISFGAYLIHWPMIGVMLKLDITGIGAFSLVIVTTLVLASISLYFYERPVQKILRSSKNDRAKNT